MSKPYDNLKALGLTLPDANKPLAGYVPAVQAGSLVFVSGQLPIKDGHCVCVGAVGDTVSEKMAYEAARLCFLNSLAAFCTLGFTLENIVRVVKLTGFVRSAPDFSNQPFVINGASELSLSIFGDEGKHSRAAVGVCQLPLNASVELEAIFQVASS